MAMFKDIHGMSAIIIRLKIYPIKFVFKVTFYKNIKKEEIGIYIHV